MTARDWELHAKTVHLPFRDPFRIARESHGAGLSMTTVLVEVTNRALPAITGYGEGYPDAYYGETPATIDVVLPLLLHAIDLDLHSVETARASLTATGLRFDEVIRGHGAAKCALDIALHDFAGKALGVPVHGLLGLPASIPPTDFTLGIDEPTIVQERARRAAHFPALKIKVGGPADIATLEGVRAVFGGPIRVDANTGWTPESARRLVPELVRLGVELIEQPFPARRLDWMRELQAGSALPIVADESAVLFEDLEGLVGVCAGVNVKLAKCGGVGAAHRMLARARELGFRTFLGCMEETSVGISASAAVASLADWVDLDGCLLLADDPFEGLVLDDGCTWLLGSAPGLGVAPKPAWQAPPAR